MSQDKEREAFEAHYAPRWGRHYLGWSESAKRYEWDATQEAWFVWQARAALASQPPAVQGEIVAWGWRSADGQIRDCIAPDTHAHQEGEYTIPLCLCTPSCEVEPLTEWEIRGTLARLKCWHRLTEQEADELVQFAMQGGIHSRGEGES